MSSPTASPGCRDHLDGMRTVLVGARDRKRAMNAVDFDDLLLRWRAPMSTVVDRSLEASWAG